MTDDGREWPGPRPSKARKAVHALGRGAVVAVGVGVVALAIRGAFGDPVGAGDLSQAATWGLLLGAVAAGKWYWEATGGDPF